MVCTIFIIPQESARKGSNVLKEGLGTNLEKRAVGALSPQALRAGLVLTVLLVDLEILHLHRGTGTASRSEGRAAHHAVRDGHRITQRLPGPARHCCWPHSFRGPALAPRLRWGACPPLMGLPVPEPLTSQSTGVEWRRGSTAAILRRPFMVWFVDLFI